MGARMMLADGLYKRFPKPDYCLALHADALLETGHIHYTEGLAMANVDTVEITVKGKGGHGAAPHLTVDPIVVAAKLVLDLQTIVGREMNPTDPGVVTVGSIHGGTKANIIPNDVKLQITVRSTTDKTRKQILEAITRKAKAAAAGANAPEPEVTHVIDEFTPKLENHPELTRKTVDCSNRFSGRTSCTRGRRSWGVRISPGSGPTGRSRSSCTSWVLCPRTAWRPPSRKVASHSPVDTRTLTRRSPNRRSRRG